MRLLSFPELRSIKGIPYTRQHIHRLVKAGRFPPPVKLNDGPGATNAWPEPEIDRHLQDRIAARDAAAAEKVAQPAPAKKDSRKSRTRSKRLHAAGIAT